LLTLLRQKPQKTFGWSGRSVALTDVAPVPSTKLMASGEPITRPAGGGQSWLVGYASLSGESPGVQVRPSFGPPLQTRVVALQIGHVWMSVLQVPPAQSSFVMQPKPASLPPTHRPRSQEPPTPQSGFARHAVSAGLAPRRHRPVSFWHVPPPGQVRTLPVSACVVAARVSVVPLHALTRSDETPVSGTRAGRGTASFTPPK